MHKIDVGKELSRIVGTRDSIRKLKIKDNTVLDFKNVEFISRAAAHELLTLIWSKNVQFRNMNTSVRKMFDVVSTSIRSSCSSYKRRNKKEVIF